MTQPTEYDRLRAEGFSDHDVAVYALDAEELADYYRAHGIRWGGGYIPGTPKRHPVEWDGGES